MIDVAFKKATRPEMIELNEKIKRLMKTLTTIIMMMMMKMLVIMLFPNLDGRIP